MTNGYDSAFSARCIPHTLFTFNYFGARSECNSVLLESRRDLAASTVRFGLALK